MQLGCNGDGSSFVMCLVLRFRLLPISLFLKRFFSLICNNCILNRAHLVVDERKLESDVIGSYESLKTQGTYEKEYLE